MTALLFFSAVLVVTVRWLCSSPLRLAAAGGVLAFAHPVPVVAVAVVTAVAVIAVAGRVIYRSLRAEGWHLVTVHRPGYAVSRAGVTS
ncbi:hypothetical protein [Actinomadura chibensis]|uniref:Uncharacterized protein n=1 Tax=Actinomadura chibensis TaxID=392828 RepID=A0A5D0NUF5_9ACTN|nr:hypothetical protein [Actinomadura chibensis]TYB47872.1 hypothetical protein FXF69_01050 [Actinomadura chibensis]